MRKFIRLSAGILVLMLSLPAFAHTPGWSGCTRTCVQSNPNLDPHDPHCPSEPAPLACQGGGSVVVAPTLTGCQITGNVGLCSSYGQPTLAPTPPTSSSNGSIPATPVPESEGYTNTNVDNQKEKLVQDNLNYQLTLDRSIGQIIKTITELEDQNSAIHFQHIS